MGTVITAGSGIRRFSFAEPDGTVYASFRLNPVASDMARKVDELSTYFEERKSRAITSATDWENMSHELDKKICYLLGYNAHDELFGLIDAGTVMEDGTIFGLLVLETIADAIKPEMEQRAAHIQSKIDSYNAKYSDGV